MQLKHKQDIKEYGTVCYGMILSRILDLMACSPVSASIRMTEWYKKYK